MKISCTTDGGLCGSCSPVDGNFKPVTMLGAQYLHDASSDLCDPFGFRQSWLNQFELDGGLSFSF